MRNDLKLNRVHGHFGFIFDDATLAKYWKTSLPKHNIRGVQKLFSLFERLFSLSKALLKFNEGIDFCQET